MYSKLSCKLSPEREGREREEKNIKGRTKLSANRQLLIKSHIYQRDLNFRGICCGKRQERLWEVVQPIKLSDIFQTISQYYVMRDTEF